MSDNGIFINEERPPGTSSFYTALPGQRDEHTPMEGSSSPRHAGSSGKPGRNRIPELSNIPWAGPSAITRYAQAGRNLTRDLGEEFALGADELYEVLIRSFKGHPVLSLFGAPDVRRRAKRVVKRLKRAAELQKGAGVELVKFHAQFRKEFVDVLPPANPEKRRSTFNWNEGM
ncbi:hypothetical protein ACWDA3_51235 [Nonomuraea rubra]